MARYERNRGMFFGSWSGISQEEYTNLSSTIKTTAYSNPTRRYYYNLQKADLLGKYFEDGTYRIKGGYSNYYSQLFLEIYKKNGDNWERIIASIPSSMLLEKSGIYTRFSGSVGSSMDNICEFTYTSPITTWEAIGKDNDSLLKELSPDTEKIKNVLGEMSFRHKGYQPEISVDRYYVDPNRKLYKRMLLNALEEKHSENDLKGFFAEAFFLTANKETMTMTGYCYVRQAYFVPQSTGGDTSGLSIPFTIVPIGSMTRKDIVYHMSNNEAFIK